MSHLLPTMITWALSHEYVLIWVALKPQFECLGLVVSSDLETHTDKQILESNDIPVLDGVEGLLIGDVIHQDEAHGTTVVGCGDGAVALLPSCVLETNTDRGLHIRLTPWSKLKRSLNKRPGHGHDDDPEGEVSDWTEQSADQLWWSTVDQKNDKKISFVIFLYPDLNFFSVTSNTNRVKK